MSVLSILIIIFIYISLQINNIKYQRIRF